MHTHIQSLTCSMYYITCSKKYQLHVLQSSYLSASLGSQRDYVISISYTANIKKLYVIALQSYYIVSLCCFVFFLFLIYYTDFCYSHASSNQRCSKAFLRVVRSLGTNTFPCDNSKHHLELSMGHRLLSGKVWKHNGLQWAVKHACWHHAVMLEIGSVIIISGAN